MKIVFILLKINLTNNTEKRSNEQENRALKKILKVSRASLTYVMEVM